MASLASAAERHNLIESSTKIGLATLVSITSMIPTFRSTSSFNMERVNLSQASESFVKVRQMFSEMINLFNGINKEEEKRSILLERERFKREEDRQEKITPRVVREGAVEEEDPQSSRMFGGIVQVISQFFRLVSSGIFRLIRTLAESILTMVRYVGRLMSLFIGLLRALRFLRYVPGYGSALRLAFGAAAAAGMAAFLDRPNFEEEANTIQEYLERQFLRPLGAGAGGANRSTERAPPATGSGGAASQTPGGATEAMNFFMSQGYTREQSAGIVSNLIAESSLIPTNHNIAEDSRGIAQWNNRGAAPGQPGRRDRVEQFLGRPVLQSSFQDQLRAVAWELSSSGPERNAGELLRRTTTAEEAADVIMNQYERPSQSERVRTGPGRRATARNLLSSGASQPTTGEGSPQNQSSTAPAEITSQQRSRSSSIENIESPNSSRSSRTVIGSGSGGGGINTAAVFLLPVRIG